MVSAVQRAIVPYRAEQGVADKFTLQLISHPMLRSTHFVFRPFIASDAPAFVEAVRESTTTLAPWMPWADKLYSMAQALAWIDFCRQGWEQRHYFEFGVFEAGSGAFVGGCGLNQLNPLHAYCNLGYWVRTSAQRRGAATEAICTLSQFGFAELHLGRIEIAVAVGNAASLGAARRAGALEECVARNRLKLGERFIDAHVLSLVAVA